MQKGLEAVFNHWRKDASKKPLGAPHTARQAKEQKSGKSSVSTDCSADPCSCTGCSSWD